MIKYIICVIQYDKCKTITKPTFSLQKELYKLSLENLQSPIKYIILTITLL